MAERPILFNAEMVRAILDGRKTQTRRVVKPGYGDDNKKRFLCPYGQPGDTLWVRESFSRARDDTPDGIFYPASRLLRWFDGQESAAAKEGAEKLPRDGKTRPSIHMPRWASRITLEITRESAERLQDISEEDALAEGVACPEYGTRGMSAKTVFRDLWDSIAQPGYKFSDNPWVWVVEFKRKEASHG